MANPYRALCSELVEQVQRAINDHGLCLEASDALMHRARALLDQTVAEGPTYQEMQDLASHCVKGSKSIEWVIQAALARWGRPTPQPPAAGEVGELVEALTEAVEIEGVMCNKVFNGKCSTFACLQRGGYVRGAGITPNYSLATCPALKRSIAFRRAADLLQHQHPQPVAVSERPWEREGWCDKQGRCWCFFYKKKWEFRWPQPNVHDTHCLPAYAIPTPENTND